MLYQQLKLKLTIRNVCHNTNIFLLSYNRFIVGIYSYEFVFWRYFFILGNLFSGQISRVTFC